jgi:hypothetical protein
MIRTFELSATPIAPADPCKKLPVGPTDLRDPGGKKFVAAWLAHVEAGRIGGNPPMSEAARDALLANERLICGRQRTFPG